MTVNKIALSTALLFFISFASLISNSEKIVNSGIKPDFPFVEIYKKNGKEYTRVSFNPKNKIAIPLEWYIKQFTNKLSVVLIFIIAMLKPDFPKWLFTLWLAYFVIIVLDWQLFYERWPWRYETDSAIMGVHTMWLFYKYAKFD